MSEDYVNYASGDAPVSRPGSGFHTQYLQVAGRLSQVCGPLHVSGPIAVGGGRGRGRGRGPDVPLVAIDRHGTFTAAAATAATAAASATAAAAPAASATAAPALRSPHNYIEAMSEATDTPTVSHGQLTLRQCRTAS